eukprot:141055_1
MQPIFSVLLSYRFIMAFIATMGMSFLVCISLLHANWKGLSRDKADDKDMTIIKLVGAKLLVLWFILSPTVMLWIYYHRLKQLNEYETHQIIIHEVIGFMMSICGQLLWQWSVCVMGKQYTGNIQIFEDHKLIDYGPYSIVRHPAYFAYFLWIVGILIYNMANPLYFPLGLMMIIGLPRRINAEEIKLRSHFGTKQHDKFCRKVKYKYIPFIW